MPAGHVTYSSSQKALTKYVWYPGNREDLKPGYALCYDHTAPINPTGTDVNKNAQIRGRQVVKPATGNLNFFAGVVAQVAPQFEGAGQVEIVQPYAGESTHGHSDENLTALEADIGLVNDEWALKLTPTVAVARTMEVIDRSTTAGSALVYFI